MRVLIPFVGEKHPWTVKGAPANAEWVDVGGDRFNYWRVLAEWWARGETFLVLEHDVICTSDVVERMESCSEPWCANPYDDMCHPAVLNSDGSVSPGCMDAWRNTLGCTRFEASLMQAVPDALTSITEDGLLDWHNVCDGLGDNLRAAGFTHHWHFPPIYHHHMGRPTTRSWAPVYIEDRPEVLAEWEATHG